MFPCCAGKCPDMYPNGAFTCEAPDESPIPYWERGGKLQKVDDDPCEKWSCKNSCNPDKQTIIDGRIVYLDRVAAWC